MCSSCLDIYLTDLYKHMIFTIRVLDKDNQQYEER